MSSLETYTQPIEGLRRYDGIDELNAVACRAGAEATQVQPGRLQSVYRVATLPHVHLAAAAYSGAVLFRGAVPRGACILGIPVQRDGTAFQGTACAPDEVLFSPPGADFEVALGPGARHMVVAIEAQALEAALEARRGTSLRRLASSRYLRVRDPQARDRLLATTARLAFRAACLVRSGSAAGAQARALEAELFEALLTETLPDAATREVPDRHRIARRAATLIRDRAAGNDSLVAIALELGTTLRTVESGFRDLLGVTPREYRHAVRLHRARADLRNPADGDTVSLIAMRHGLVHLGRFSVDYRELFGESPSQTLRHARDGAGRAFDARAA